MNEKMEVGNTEKGIYEEIELASDLQQYIARSKDVKLNEKLKSEIIDFPPDTLLSVTKKIQSPIEIIDVKIVNENFVKTAFPSVKF